MSGYLSGKVWASDLDGTLKPLAASLADMVNDHGEGIEAGLMYLAWRMSRSRSTVQEQLKQLRDLELIMPTCHEHCRDEPGRGHGRRQPVIYHFDETKLPARRPWAEHREEQLARRRKRPNLGHFEMSPETGHKPNEPEGRALPEGEKSPDQPPKVPQFAAESARSTGGDPDPETVLETAPSLPSPPSMTSEQHETLGYLHAEVRRLIHGGTGAPAPGWCDDLARRGMTKRDVDEAIQAALDAGARREAYVRRVLARYIEDRERGEDPHARSGAVGGGEAGRARNGDRARGGRGAGRAARRGGAGARGVPGARGRPGRTETGDEYEHWRLDGAAEPVAEASRG